MRQCALLALTAIFAASCSKSDGFQSPAGPGQIDYLKGFIGGVAADEPRAALVARDILSAGGSAADAAAAAALTYAVTYPAGGGLGSGGFCVVSNAASKRTETVEFPLVAAKAGGPVAVPGLLRGLGLLQSRHGRLRWEAVVTPAEQLARFGEPTSRAFVQAMTEAQPPVTGNPALAQLYGTRGGTLPTEGERRVQFNLAGVLGRLRNAGPADFYQGATAKAVLADSAAIGGGITAEELRGYAASLGKPIEVPFENSMVLYASNNAGGGAIAAWLIEQGYDGGSFLRSANVFSNSSGVRTDSFVASLGQANRGIAAAPPMHGYGSSSIAVIDTRGMAVSCAFSMGPAFGARLVGRETGMLFAAPPGAAGDESPYMAAIVGSNPRIGLGFVAAAATGGAPSAASLAYSVLQVALGKAKKDPAVPALAEPRLFQASPQAPLLHEPGVDPAILADARKRGVTMQETGRLGRVNLTYCSNGLPRAPESCSFAADRRGYGLGIGRQF